MTDASGRFEGGVHHYALRVYYADTDAAGMVYHGNYLNFAERARTECMRLLGIESQSLREEHGIYFAVTGCGADFLKPARLDDLLDVRSSVVFVSAARLTVAQTIWRGDTQLTRIEVRLAVVGFDGRPRRLPPEVRAAFQAFTKETD